MNAFKPQGIEYICGKNRNIYFKMNKNNTALGKTRYIKYKREFIKLSIFIKEHYNKKTKKYINYEKKPNVTIINNINDIKDKKIRALFKRTFKKNAKIYIYSSKKIKRGGGDFDVDVHRNNDKPLHRHPTSQLYDYALLPRASRKNSDPYPYKLNVPYNTNFDNIIYEITELSKDKTHFERINNLKYEVSFKDVVYYIRPHIDFTAPYKRFIINFYVSTDNFSPVSHPEIKRWIKLPLHVSLFINDMIEKKKREGRRAYDEEYEIAMLNTGHIHITSDDKIENFNISSYLELKTKSGAASSRGRAHSSGAASSTHTYLIADSLNKVAYIMNKHGEKIFKDWYYDVSTETDTKHKKFTLFAPINNKWGASPGGDIDIALKTDEKKEIFEECFKKLHYIIGNIFYILHNNRVERNGIPSSISLIQVTTTDPTYIPYKQQQQPEFNISYIDRDSRAQRYGLIDIDDLNKGKLIAPIADRSRSPDPRDHRRRVDMAPYISSEGFGSAHSGDVRRPSGEGRRPSGYRGRPREGDRRGYMRAGVPSINATPGDKKKVGNVGVIPPTLPTFKYVHSRPPLFIPSPSYTDFKNNQRKKTLLNKLPNQVTKKEIDDAKAHADANLRSIQETGQSLAKKSSSSTNSNHNTYKNKYMEERNFFPI